MHKCEFLRCRRWTSVITQSHIEIFLKILQYLADWWRESCSFPLPPYTDHLYPRCLAALQRIENKNLWSFLISSPVSKNSKCCPTSGQIGTLLFSIFLPLISSTYRMPIHTLTSALFYSCHHLLCSDLSALMWPVAALVWYKLSWAQPIWRAPMQGSLS